MTCILRLSAPNIEHRLAAIRFQPYRLQHGSAHFKVSDREFGDLPGQVQDALEFLREHSQDLQSMMAPGASGSLDFAVHIPSQGFVTNSFPASLVSLAGGLGLGLDLSAYPGEGSHAV
ncbi:hypothetical protein [Ideonella oryzae]|uniref:DUF4279 domain-containing protein n=1 Tax=Ideonella oryzae TaxID=2937441 RepID=A0ABT1BR15_9BURK|nr:hypothetical protein [Ideonella oryzae]MCO5978681.1 hypothetical protein [Ideonella oryzae]